MRAIISGALCTLCVTLAACYNTQTLSGDTSTDAPDTRDSGPEPRPDTAIDPPRPDGPVPDVADVPPDGDPWPCTPELAPAPILILGSLNANVGWEDDPDHPDLITLESGQVWLVSRVVDYLGPSDTPQLTFVEVEPSTARPNSPYFNPVTHVDIDPLHPTVPYGETMATVHQDLGSWSMNEILYRIMGTPPSSGSLGSFSDTSILSSQPAAASSGTGLCAAWRQESDSSWNATIDFGIVNEVGDVSAMGSLFELSGENPSDPMVVFNGSGYGILFVFNSLEGERMLMLGQIDEDGTVTDPPLSVLSETITGRHAVVWNGSEYAIIFEGSDRAEGTLALITRSHSGSGSGTFIQDTLEPYTGPITEPLGMLDMVWTGSRYGVVWTHASPSPGSHVWFFELSRDGNLVGGPHLLNPEATQSFNPAITRIETPTMRYYVFAWNELVPVRGYNVVYTYSYGCSM